MAKILIPVLDSVNALPAVRHALNEHLHGEPMEVHLLYLRNSVLSRVAGWWSGRDRLAADKSLQRACELLQRFHVQHAVHLQNADKALAIDASARRLKVDRIVLGTARHYSATRLTEESVIRKVIDAASVPVTLVAGKAVSPVERYGVAAGLGGTLLLILIAE